jgi:hypothetical protein
VSDVINGLKNHNIRGAKDFASHGLRKVYETKRTCYSRLLLLDACLRLRHSHLHTRVERRPPHREGPGSLLDAAGNLFGSNLSEGNHDLGTGIERLASC